MQRLEQLWREWSKLRAPVWRLLGIDKRRSLLFYMEVTQWNTSLRSSLEQDQAIPEEV